LSRPLWRIAVEAPTYTANDLTGKGAESSGGRWNAKGTALVYCATNISLAALETIVHFSSDALPLNRYLVRIDVPEEIWNQAVILDPSKLGGWDALPAGKSSVDWGQKWIKSGASALAIVPSVVVPEDVNCLINPQHADVAKITSTTLRKWLYDGRIKG
jgi:RES domain-containing protein